MKYLTLEKDGPVGVITLSNDRENRFSPDFINEILETMDSVEKDKETGALVFTGADPKFFSNGLDLTWIMQNIADPAAIVGYLKLTNSMFKRFCLYPKPIVAALNGHTFAAGVFLTAYMDFRFMREDRGWVCLPEVDINIPLLPAMIAICQAVMTPQGFREMYYTGARFTGPEALKLGFVDRVYPEAELLPKSIEFAAGLAKKKTATYAEMKRRIRADIARILDEVDPEYFVETLSFSMR
ncbi:MAG: enoyl-CoA hydratase/isomerase family protein [bacterium]